METYCVSLPFQGSLCVQVEANSEEEALKKGAVLIDSYNAEDIANNAEFDHYEVYKL